MDDRERIVSNEQSTEARAWLIELLAWWEGRVNTSPLQRYFNISRQSASKHLNQYLEQYPGALEYRSDIKAYIPAASFRYHHISGDVAEYLNWVTGIAPAPPDNKLHHHVIQHPPRHISPDIIRPLVIALRERRRVDVEYQSVSSADSEERLISPHTFVNTGLRWHVRAWCEKNRDYRDFVLSRFRGQPDLQDGVSEYTAEKDVAWNTQVTLIIQPDPRLSDRQKAVIERDYLMQNGALLIQTRAALAQYTLQDLQVNTKMLDGNPAAQQLVLANYEEVKGWLF